MRPEKQLLLDDIKERLGAAPSFLLARYQSLAANAATDFRSALRSAGGDFEVVRKRVLIKAAAAAEVEIDRDALQGHIGIVFTGEDAVGTTKAVFKFGKESDAIEVVGGRIDGVNYTAEQVKRISKLPSQDEMRSQLLGLFEAPMAQTLAVCEALLTSVIHCLNNKAQLSE